MREQCQRVLHHAARCPRLVLTAAGIADIVGKKIAEHAAAKGITEVVFDRGGYIFHGRVAELANGAREGGLKF